MVAAVGMDLGLKFSPRKSKVVVIGHELQGAVTQWSVGDTELPVCSSYRYLGVNVLGQGFPKWVPRFPEAISRVPPADYT